MKLSDRVILNMERILKNLSDFMKKTPGDAGAQWEQKPEIGSRLSEIIFAPELARIEAGDTTASVFQNSGTDAASKQKHSYTKQGLGYANNSVTTREGLVTGVRVWCRPWNM